MKKRPRIRLRVPAGVTAGSTFDVEVVLDAAKAVDIEYVALQFGGLEAARRGHGEHARRASRSLARQSATLSGARKLPAGRTSLTCRLSLPADAPPSYRGRGAEVVYRLEVHVSIPWWPDARGAWEIHVARPIAPPESPDPIIYSTAPEGPKAREAYLEVSLPTRAAPAGRGLEGVIALGNVAWNRYRGLRLSLRGMERLLIRGNESEATVEDYRLPIALATAEEGKGIPFSFLVPPTAYPSYTSPSGIWSRVWWFEVRAEVRLGFDVVATFPVRILPQGTARRAEGRARFVAPTVGAERLQQVWASAAESVGFAADGESLRGRAGDTEIELRREHRAGQGIWVVGQLRYPPLHLGLSLSHPSFRGPRVVGRMPAQVEALLAAIGPLVRSLSLTHLDDGGLSVEWRDAGHARLRLISFTNDLKALAAALARARKEIPPPWAMADAVPAWERLVNALDGGRLVIATMEAHGAFEGQAVAIRTEWDGIHPMRTVVELTPRAPLALEPGAPLGGDARPIVELLSEGAVSFRAAPEALTLVLPAPQREHEPILAALRRMTRLAALLRPREAVYR